MKPWRSIRVRLAALIGLLLFAALGGFGSLAWLRESKARIAAVDRELDERLNLLISAYRPEPGQRLSDVSEARLSPRAQMLFANEGGEPFYHIVWYRDGSLQGRSEHAPDVEMPQGPAGSRMIRASGGMRELLQFTQSGRCFLVGRSIQPEREATRKDALMLVAAGGAILFVGLLVGWWISSSVTRPLGVVGRTSREIANGDLSRRIPTTGREDEIEDVAEILNETFARLEQAFERQKQFTADASHELRTPVSLILAHTQGALLHEQTPEDYREALADCERAAGRMKTLIESLLDLAKLDGSPAAIDREPCDLAQIVHECVVQLQPLVRKKDLRFDLDLQSAPCLGDGLRLTQVATNLLTNAIQHSPSGSIVSARTSGEDQACLVIQNTGLGIPPEEMPDLFERFHRSDKSRARATGGTGLGLAICKAIVEAHGGHIQAESVPGETTIFRISLPKNEAIL